VDGEKNMFSGLMVCADCGHMLNELIDYKEVYQAEKIAGKHVQKLKIHYNCVGTFKRGGKAANRKKVVGRQTALRSRACKALAGKAVPFCGRGGAMERYEESRTAKRFGILSGAQFAPTWCR
jgi:hypothetical protein